MKIIIEDMGDEIALSVIFPQNRPTWRAGSPGIQLSEAEKKICRRMVISAAFEHYFPGHELEIINWAVLDPEEFKLPTDEWKLAQLEALP